MSLLPYTNHRYRYVKDIVVKTSSSVEQVTIEPNGVWSVQSELKEEPTVPRVEANVVDDDDLVFMSNHNTETPIRSSTNFGTPIAASREGSSMPRSASSSKRPIADVIDLTLSDDDEPPQPPTKRLNTGLPSWDHI